MKEVKSGKSKGCLPTVPILNGFEVGAVIELKNSMQTLYLPYNNPTNTIQHIEISYEFMKLNGWKDGQYNICRTDAQIAQNIKVIVSKQHYEVIQENRGMFERIVLGQAQLVWNGVIIPISYSEKNTVIMRCQCQPGVWWLAQETHLEIEPEMTSEQQQKQLIFKVVPRKNQPNSDIAFVHPNDLGTLKSDTYYAVQPFEYIPPQVLKNFTEYQKNAKYFQQKKSTSANKLTPILIKFKESGQVDQHTLHLSESFWKLNNEPISLKLLHEYTAIKDSQLVMTLDYFSNETKIKVFAICLKESMPDLIDFYSKMARLIIVEQQFLFGNNNVMVMDCEYYMLRIQSSEGKGKEQKIVNINNLLIRKNRQVDQTRLVEILKKKMVLLPQKAYFSKISESDKAAVLLKLKILKPRKNQRISKNSQFFSILYEEQVQKIQTLLLNRQHIMLASPNKNGKTFLSLYLQQHCNKNLFYIDLSDISLDSSSRLKDILDYLELIFQTYCNHIIFIDNIDSICQDVGTDRHRQQQIIAAKILSKKLWQFINLYSHQSCIITVQNADNVDQKLKQLDFTTVVLRNPPTEARRKYLLDRYSKEQTNKILENTQSKSFRELVDILSDNSKIDKILKKKEEKVDLHDFSKIAGMKTAKQTILDIIESPFKYSYLYKNLPIKMPKGVLLYGPSGVGKTHLATAVKQQLKMSFFEVKGTDVFNMYIGASEQAVRDIFQKAMAAAPSVVFFDEFQSLVPMRTANSSGVGDRVVNQFLCYLDGVSSLEGVFILAASSKPHLIDPALLRPGRIDKHVFLDYPTKEERIDLLKIFEDAIQFEYSLEEVANLTQSYSYSDMVGLLQQLRIKKASELLKQPNFDKDKVKYIDKEFFDKIFQRRKIPMTPEHKKQISKGYQEFAQSRQVVQQRSALK